LEDVEEFLRTEQMPVVVKPVESAGSDGVKLCHSEEEAREHFEVLMGAQQKTGSQGAAVLCQEFLRGKEYVVDHVSMDGVHKTVMIWVYDKRAVNGAAFVYHGMLPVPSDSPEAQVLIPYVRGVLDALQIKNGPTHGEVMMTPDGPCLVEMNCRAMGGDGSFMPLARALTGGYSQVDAAVDSFLDAQKFDQLPDRPPSPFLAAGQWVLLVSFTEGKVKSCPGYERIKALDSFVYLESAIDAGCRIDYTTDLFTNVGSAILMHADEAQLRSDVEAIRKMEKDCALFELEEHPENLCRPRARSEHVTMISEIGDEALYGA
jgi:biotin carboxylase